MPDRSDPWLHDKLQALHEADHELRKAHAAPAGPGRIDRLNKAYEAHSKATQAYEHHVSGQASPPIPTKR